MSRLIWGLALLVVVTACVELPTLAASEQDVINLINALSISSSAKQTVAGGFLRGISDGRLSADQAFAFLQRVSTSGASIPDRETVLVAIAQTLLEDIPVEMLISKVEEGLTRGVPLEVIAAEVLERQQTLEEVKALFDRKGIRIQQQPNGPGFPRSEVDAAVTDTATVLENHVRSGKDPHEGTLLAATLATLQRDGRIGDELFQALSGVLSEAELAQLAENIETRLNP